MSESTPETTSNKSPELPAYLQEAFDDVSDGGHRGVFQSLAYSLHQFLESTLVEEVGAQLKDGQSELNRIVVSTATHFVNAVGGYLKYYRTSHTTMKKRRRAH